MNTSHRYKTDKESDNVETLKIQDLLLNALKDIDPIEFNYTKVDPIEFRSYSGFSAFDHNRGGVDFIGYTDVYSLIGSGAHMGTRMHERVDKEYSDAYNEVAKELNIDPSTDDNELREQIYDKLDPMISDDYSGYAWRVRLMYEGNKTLVVHSGWDFDAPYYRWDNKTDLEQTIKFKNKIDLKSKLKKALEKAVKKI